MAGPSSGFQTAARPLSTMDQSFFNRAPCTSFARPMDVKKLGVRIATGRRLARAGRRLLPVSVTTSRSLTEADRPPLPVMWDTRPRPPGRPYYVPMRLTRRRVTGLIGGVLVTCVCLVVWTASRMVIVGEYASDHGTSGDPGNWLWLVFLSSLVVGCASIPTLIVLGEKGRHERRARCEEV